MKSLIGDSLKSALVEQLGQEIYNSHLYLYTAAFLNSKGLSNLAKHFEGQHKEEQDHALIIYNLLVDLGVDFDMPEIMGCSMPFQSILDVANIYLEREVITTESLNEIKNQAMGEIEYCPVVEERMRDMIETQQHEYREATDFFDKASLTEGDWKFVLLWDSSLKG
jgi:ferritin